MLPPLFIQAIRRSTGSSQDLDTRAYKDAFSLRGVSLPRLCWAPEVEAITLGFPFSHRSSVQWKPLHSLFLSLSVSQSNVMVVKDEAQCWIEAYESENEQGQGVSQARLVGEDEAACALGLGFPPHQRRSVVVGYALTSKKIKSFMKPKLEGLAR